MLSASPTCMYSHFILTHTHIHTHTNTHKHTHAHTNTHTHTHIHTQREPLKYSMRFFSTLPDTLENTVSEGLTSFHLGLGVPVWEIGHVVLDVLRPQTPFARNLTLLISLSSCELLREPSLNNDEAS